MTIGNFSLRLSTRHTKPIDHFQWSCKFAESGIFAFIREVAEMRYRRGPFESRRQMSSGRPSELRIHSHYHRPMSAFAARPAEAILGRSQSRMRNMLINIMSVKLQGTEAGSR
jgi:hypothetical protein